MNLVLFLLFMLSAMTTTAGSICSFLDSMNIMPCKNCAECLPVGTFGFHCQCLDGYSGGLCQTDTDECAINPCLNGGTCTDGINSYNCSCPEFFTGQNCETEMNTCKSSPCKNGGICKNRGADYICFCPYPFDFVGTDCQKNCLLTTNGPYFTLHHEETTITTVYPKMRKAETAKSCIVVGAASCELLEAYGLPCYNGGTCLDLVNGHRCACPDKYSGVRCEQLQYDAKLKPLQDQRRKKQEFDGDKTSDVKCKDHVCLLQKNYGFAIIGGGGYGNTVTYWNSSSGQAIDTELNVPNSLIAHAATALLNDSVLVTGGYTQLSEESSYSHTIQLGSMKAEILSSGRIMENRLDHGSVLLPDGRVLLCGGSRGVEGLHFASCFTYNAGAWTRSAPMLSTRSLRFGMASDGDYVYVVGGWVEGGNLTNSAEKYDPARDRWESIPSLPGPLVAFLSLVHVNGKLYAIGGYNGTGPTSLVQIYDIQSGTWNPGPELNRPRNSHSALATPDGSIWVFGGITEPNTVEVLPAGAAHWSLLSNTLPRDVALAQVLWLNKPIIADTTEIPVKASDNQ